MSYPEVFPADSKHLLFRAGFGIGKTELQSLPNPEADKLIISLLESTYREFKPILKAGEEQVDSFLGMNSRPLFQKMENNYSVLDDLRLQWFEWMVHSPHVLREKMTLFWHGHFACQCFEEYQAWEYLRVLRTHALGHFKDLLHAVVKTPAMLIFLNSQQNRKDHPNENFARELLELFTLGRGHYSEGDVKSAARAFTGWTLDKSGFFNFQAGLHDFGEKYFLGKMGHFSGENIIDMILENPRTPEFLATKLYRFFVSEDLDSKAIKSIADRLKKTDYHLGETLYYLFSSAFFYDQKVRGNRIKSPLELLVHISRLFDIRFHRAEDLSFLQKAMGQLIFEPPNVAGWPGGKSWINNSTLLLRLNLVRYLLQGERFDHATTAPYEAMNANQSIQIIHIDHKLSELIEVFGGINFDNLPSYISHTLLATRIAPDLMLTKKDRKHNFTQKTLMSVVSLPEFQMS